MRRPLSRRFSSARAFTLIELLVVILVIGILIAVAAPSFLGQTDKAHESAAKQTLAVAYRAAKAGTIREPNFGQFGTAAQVAADINASEPGINASAGDCPDDVSASVEDVIVDNSYTGGGNLLLCNDPDRKIFYLKVTNGTLEPTGSVEWAEGDPAPTIPGDGPGDVEETITDTAGPGDPVSTDDPPTDEAEPDDPIETTVEPPAVGTVTITETPGPVAPEDDTDMIDWTVNVEANAGSAASPIIFTFIIDASLVPSGMTDPHETRVFKDGTRIDANDVMCGGAPGEADPDPCVDDRSFVAGGDLRIVVFSSTDGAFTFGFPDGSAPVGGPPSNDDFENAQTISGGDGSVNGTLIESTVQPPAESDFDGNCCGYDFERSVWYSWTAPTTGTYRFEVRGSAFEINGGITPMIVVGTGGDLASLQYVDQGYPGQYVPSGNYTYTRLDLSVDSGVTYKIVIWGAPGGETNPIEGAFSLTWSDLSGDTDGDLVLNGADNCPTVSNAGQENDVNTGSAAGDACDPSIKIVNNSSHTIRLGFFEGGGQTFDYLGFDEDYPAGGSECLAGNTCVYDYTGYSNPDGGVRSSGPSPVHEVTLISDPNSLAYVVTCSSSPSVNDCNGGTIGANDNAHRNFLDLNGIPTSGYTLTFADYP